METPGCETKTYVSDGHAFSESMSCFCRAGPAIMFLDTSVRDGSLMGDVLEFRCYALTASVWKNLDRKTR